MSQAPAKTELDRALALDIVRVTEATAVAAALWRGRGNEAAADEAAASAMYRELARLPIEGVVVVGEGEENETPLLYIGETVGAAGSNPLKVDLAVDPVEGSTLCAKALPNALSVLAVAERGSLLKVPTIYMDKIAIGPGFPDGLVDLDASPTENLNALAGAKGVPLSEITVCILDRPRHAKLIEEVRASGAALQADRRRRHRRRDPCDGAARDRHRHLYGHRRRAGRRARRSGACLHRRPDAGTSVIANEQHRARARAAGIHDLGRKYTMRDMVTGDLSFAATGITDGSLLEGVRFTREACSTHTVVMRASTRTVRWIKTEHPRYQQIRLLPG